jgi:hypothetical protein
MIRRILVTSACAGLLALGPAAVASASTDAAVAKGDPISDLLGGLLGGGSGGGLLGGLLGGLGGGGNPLSSLTGSLSGLTGGLGGVTGTVGGLTKDVQQPVADILD